MNAAQAKRAASPLRRTWLRTRGWLLPILIILGWEAASRLGDAWTFAFPSVVTIADTFIHMLLSGELLFNLLATLKTAVLGLLIGGTAGLTVGAGMGASRNVEYLLGPVYQAMRQVPLLGWIPLIGLWFGQGNLSKTLIVCLAAFYPLVLNTCEGIRNVDRRYVEVGQTLSLSRLQQVRFILLPAAMPSILTGLMHALAFSWVSTVGSELLFAAGAGLGGLMQVAENGSRMDIVVLCMVCVGLVGYVATTALAALRRHLLRWHVSLR